MAGIEVGNTVVEFVTAACHDGQLYCVHRCCLLGALQWETSTHQLVCPKGRLAGSNPINSDSHTCICQSLLPHHFDVATLRMKYFRSGP